MISGRLMTSLETHGFIITIFKFDNTDIDKNNLVLKLLDYPVEVKHWMEFTPS